ncbi:MAG: hypothetical protein P8Z35_25990 [Ignavibacteriaceae bacterium]
MNKSHFERFASNELIVEGDSPVEFSIDLDVALKYLSPHIENYLNTKSKIKFDKIHIISKNTFIYDILSKKEMVKFSKNVLFNSYL